MSELVENTYAALEDKADTAIPTATLQIYDFINEYLARPKDTHINRASAASGCYKKRWYQGRGTPAKPMAPRAHINFFLGDLTERTLAYFVRKALVGPGRLYSEVVFGEVLGSIQFQGRDIEIYRQFDLLTNVGGIPVTGHADGFGKRNSDGKWELLEFKSAANWGFNDFKAVGPKEYLKQSHVLVRSDKGMALGIEGTRFFFLRKETGHLWDQYHSFSEEIWEETKGDYRASNQEAEPKAPFSPEPELYRKKPTGRFIAQYPCNYCPYLEACHGKFEVDWKADQYGHQRPVYVFKKGEENAIQKAI